MTFRDVKFVLFEEGRVMRVTRTIRDFENALITLLEKNSFESLTVDQINNKQFNTKMRGYNPEEVQEFIQEVSQTVQQLITENNNLQEQVRANDSKIKYFADLKDSLNKSILVAQEAADKVKNNAKREADIMIREAQKQATDIVSEANDKSNQVIEDAANSTKKLTSETNDLRKQTRIFRQRLQVMLESQLEVIKSNEWDKLLENDDLSKYDEIEKILGSRLDSSSATSVESTATTASEEQPVESEQPVASAEQTEEESAPVQPTAVNDDKGSDAPETVVVFPDNNK